VNDLLLRMVKVDGPLAYKFSSRAEMDMLLACAVNEVVHLKYTCTTSDLRVPRQCSALALGFPGGFKIRARPTSGALTVTT
jgi:hypothetical protein